MTLIPASSHPSVVAGMEPVSGGKAPGSVRTWSIFENRGGKYKNRFKITNTSHEKRKCCYL